jgi:hypothetical protein
MYIVAKYIAEGTGRYHSKEFQEVKKINLTSQQ